MTVCDDIWLPWESGRSIQSQMVPMPGPGDVEGSRSGSDEKRPLLLGAPLDMSEKSAGRGWNGLWLQRSLVQGLGPPLCHQCSAKQSTFLAQRLTQPYPHLDGKAELLGEFLDKTKVPSELEGHGRSCGCALGIRPSSLCASRPTRCSAAVP